MKVESFLLDEPEVVKAEVDSVHARNQERAALCAASGLEAQAKLSDGVLTDVAKFYPRISFYESEIWSQFLPERYSRNAGHWATFRYGIIPREAMDNISFADSLRLFDDLEIWTPEERLKDPVAMGVVVERGSRGQARNHRHLITRWAESLKPFDEIEKTVADSKTVRYSATPLPFKVGEFILTQQRCAPRTTFHYYGRSRNPLRWHCWRPMYRVHAAGIRAFVCAQCGWTLVKKPW